MPYFEPDKVFKKPTAFSMSSYCTQRFNIPERLVPGAFVERMMLQFGDDIWGGHNLLFLVKQCQDYIQIHEKNARERALQKEEAYQRSLNPVSVIAEKKKSTLPDGFLDYLSKMVRDFSTYESPQSTINELKRLKTFYKARHFIKQATLHQAFYLMCLALGATHRNMTVIHDAVRGHILFKGDRNNPIPQLFRWLPQGNFNETDKLFLWMGIKPEPDPTISERFNALKYQLKDSYIENVVNKWRGKGFSIDRG